ncbi:MAG TPA: zf-HC2 domain-containing protein [Thermoanaerobaculia bacterium]
MTDHPTLERLEAYRQGTLGPEEAEALQDHLAVCEECVQTLLEMGRFQTMMAAPEPKIPEDGRPSPAETEASWQALRTRLAPRPGASRPVLEAPGRFRRWTPSRRAFFQLAAALLACLIGFPLWMLSHRPTETPLLLVQPGAFEITRGGSDSRPPISVALADATAVLSLPVPSRAAFTSYRIEILTPRGETRLTVTPSLVPSASPPGVAVPGETRRIVAFSLPQRALSPGDYRLRLVGLQGAREETLAEHPLRVVS